MHRHFFWALGILSVAFYAVFVARTAFWVNGEAYFSLFDDAMISMRFARNLAEGYGLTWNPGETPIEGYTNFLWTLVMAALHGLSLPESKISLAVMVLGIAILVGIGGVVRAIAAQVASNAFLPVAIATTLVAFYYPLVFWTLRGMEVGLLVLFVYTSVWLAFRLQARFRMGELALLGLMLAMAVLTRLDAVIPHVLISAWLLLTLPAERRMPALAVLGTSFLAPLGAQTAFRLAYYHEWLPNTYYLKVTGVSLVDRIARGLKVLLQSYAHHLVFYLAPVAALFALRRTTDSRLLLLLALLVFQAAYSVYVGGDAWEWVGSANRFLTLAMPAVAVLVGLGFAALASAAACESTWAIRLAALVGASALASRGVLAVWSSGGSMVEAVLWWLMALGMAGVGWAMAARLGRWLPGCLASRPAMTWALAVLLVAVPANARLGWAWLANNAIHVGDDAKAARLGLLVRRATTPDAVVAVTWAGATPYFSHRSTLDLLGKNDPVIAKGPPATRGFFPGHNKWNLDYSLGTLRPDLVVSFYIRPSDQELAAWGYMSMPNGMAMRRETTRVNRDVMTAGTSSPERR